jgi:hypothetical protein
MFSIPLQVFATQEVPKNDPPVHDKINICHEGHVIEVDAHAENGHGDHPDDFQVNNDDDRARCEDLNDEDENKGTLSVVKVIVGNQEAQPQDFSFTTTHGEVTSAAIVFDEDGSNGIVTEAGTYSVTEVSAPNYTTTYSNCSNVEVTAGNTSTCTVTNTYVPPTTSCTFVSDSATLQNGNPSVPVSPIHSAWTAVIGGLSQWIWGENPIADPVNATSETFTRTFSLSGGTRATLDIAADNSYSVSVNGHAQGGNAGGNNFSSGNEGHFVIPSEDLVSGMNTITFTVNNFAQEGGTMASNPAGLKYKLTVTGTSCGEVPPANTATIIAKKVACTVEADLPNWGAGGPDITSTTAQDWVDSHESCALVPWDFQWAPNGTENPGDNISGLPSEWTAFVSGLATVPASTLAWVREKINTSYIPFTGANATDNVSAELYCSKDVLNYDNFDFISPVEAGKTYYCVAFNAPVQKTNSCVVPSTTGAPEHIALGISPEPPVQQTLTDNGYSTNADTDQVNVQSWDDTGNTAHFSVKALSKNSAHSHVFGYKLNDGSFVGVFRDGAVTNPSYLGLPLRVLPADGVVAFDVINVTSVVFALYDDNTGEYYYTKKASNSDNANHAVVYNPSSNEYVIGLEDVSGGDGDMNDLVVVLTVTGCEVPPPPPTQCSDELDNDGDEGVDLNDSGCDSAQDNSENTPPTLTLTGNAIVTVNTGDPYVDAGATASDVEDGNLTPSIVAVNPVNTSIAGTYSVTYDVTDGDGAAATQVTRTVIVSTPPQCSDKLDNDEDGFVDAADPACHTNGDANDSESYNGQLNSELPNNTSIITTDSTPTPSGRRGRSGSRSGGGSSSGGLVLGASTSNLPPSCEILLKTFLRLGKANDSTEVTKLQTFLNGNLSTTLPVTGFFGPLTFKAVEDFQIKYWEDVLNPWVSHGLPTNKTPTGYVYKSTQWKINKLYCESLDITFPTLP